MITFDHFGALAFVKWVGAKWVVGQQQLPKPETFAKMGSPTTTIEPEKRTFITREQAGERFEWSTTKNNNGTTNPIGPCGKNWKMVTKLHEKVFPFVLKSHHSRRQDVTTTQQQRNNNATTTATTTSTIAGGKAAKGDNNYIRHISSKSTRAGGKTASIDGNDNTSFAKTWDIRKNGIADNNNWARTWNIRQTWEQEI